MGFFKDINGDVDNNADDLVNVTTDEDVDASLLESLFDGSSDGDDIAVVDEAYDIEDGSKTEAKDENVAEEPEPVVDTAPVEEPTEEAVAPAIEEETAALIEEPVAEEPTPAPSFTGLDESAPKTTPAPAHGDEDQVTVITKGTTINGSIISDCSLNVMGTINGDIECVGKLTISGNVAGNSTASDVFVSAKRLNGNIDSEGTVKVGLGTVVIGDIKAGSAVVAGAVKGELDIQGPVVIDSTAIIKGNVKAKSVQMNNGAILEGFCSLVYSSVSVDDIFE